MDQLPTSCETTRRTATLHPGLRFFNRTRTSSRRMKPTRMATTAFLFSGAPVPTHLSPIRLTVAHCLMVTTKTPARGTSGETITLARQLGSESREPSQENGTSKYEGLTS